MTNSVLITDWYVLQARKARETLSVEERQRRNREYRKRREIINSQPEFKKEFIRKERRKRVEEGKKSMIWEKEIKSKNRRSQESVEKEQRKTIKVKIPLHRVL
ncbi:hypothetical protein CHARACLAT_025061 [Characodon lateralis]|uniref:Uncharacterized protein n=1 Tax=Characodon lateralis TaxID=208331 RepID=A0ABU7CRS9_9TELE|nr:hypothetical protein [Characodon lateralis]